MKTIFREYHQFSEEEFKILWKTCIFVLDTNTLLNMYRYSRETVKQYFQILNELKENKQLWIPYQVGYEFFENRPNVISTLEKSYDEILTIVNTTQSQIEKIKNHPFLDLDDIKKKINHGLEKVTKEILDQKNKHPEWLKTDDVLQKINELFDDNVGESYTEEELEHLYKEGQDRYDKKIPPGFKDNAKQDNKKYGDFILWKQIIDKAIQTKKSIILISGDVKEDWWLEKDGQRIMPLPKLKKEIYRLANVDFHIYTADKFLEYYKKNKKQNIPEKAIEEIRIIREIQEEKILRERYDKIIKKQGKEEEKQEIILEKILKDNYENDKIRQQIRIKEIAKLARKLFLIAVTYDLTFPRELLTTMTQLGDETKNISLNEVEDILEKLLMLIDILKEQGIIEEDLRNISKIEKNLNILKNEIISETYSYKVKNFMRRM